jgi:hypothetical protein
MNKKIRGMINKELKIRGLRFECHHASWRNGGLSSPSLPDRSNVFTTRSFAQMRLSRDMRVRAVVRQFIADERDFRRIETAPMHHSLTGQKEKARHRDVNYY